VNPLPTVNAGADQNITLGNAANLTATGTGSFEWSTGETTASITVSPTTTTTYTVTLTNANSCSASDAVVVNVSTSGIVVNIISYDITCFGANNGIAIATASGGTAPYTYVWTGNLFGSSISNLSAGVFTVTAYDQLGASGTASVTINEPAELIANTVVVNETTTGSSDGSITVNVSGGVPPYSYLWDATTGNQITPTAVSLTSGIYTVTITDSTHCNLIVSDTVIANDVSIMPYGLVENYSLYPNPTSGPITIKLTNMNLLKVTVTDLLGRELYIRKNINNTFTISMAGLKQGMYIVSLYTVDKVYTNKIVLDY
jgi:large repetitive protein